VWLATLPRWATVWAPCSRAVELASQHSALEGGSHVFCSAAARRCRPAPLTGYDAGVPRWPGASEQGQRYAADPPTVEEIVAVIRYAGHCRDGARLNGLIVILWRAGLRINEALSLTETDLDQRRGSILVRQGKNDRRREVGMDAWGWSALAPWLAERATLPDGPLFCVIAGPTRGHAWSAGAARL
jgi:integrase